MDILDDGNYQKIRLLNRFLVISIITFLIALSFSIDKLAHLSSTGDLLSYRNHYYYGVLPAVLISYAGIDVAFLLEYLKELFKGNRFKKVLIAWRLSCILPIVPVVVTGYDLTNDLIPVVMELIMIPFAMSVLLTVFLQGRHNDGPEIGSIEWFEKQ